MAEYLMNADQGGGAEAQEADGVGNFFFFARFDQGAVEGDVAAPVADAGIDDAKVAVATLPVSRHGRAGA